MTPTAGERGESTRRQLLQATATVIARHGWGAVTTRRVAEQAGVNAGLVHYHFTSVDDLRRQATLAALEHVLAPVIARLETASDLSETLEVLLRDLDSIDPEVPEVALLYEAFLAAVREDAIRAELGGALRGFRRHVADLLRNAGAEDPDDLAALVAAAIDGILLHTLVDPDLDPTRIVGPLGRLLPPGSRP